MHNCIFAGHCNHQSCDESCPALAETTYLLERNNLSMNSHVFKTNVDKLIKFSNILEDHAGELISIFSQDTVKDADLVTYAGICKNWKGNRLHCSVYNLKYSNMVDRLKDSWGTHQESSDLEYMKIFARSAKILIISNIDYINFKDFECQTLLSLIQSRAGNNLTTVIVTPTVSSLVGSSPFFGRLTDIIRKARKAGVDE